MIWRGYTGHLIVLCNIVFPYFLVAYVFSALKHGAQRASFGPGSVNPGIIKGIGLLDMIDDILMCG